MASNRIPQDLKELISLASDAKDGARDYGEAIGLLQNTEAKIGADLLPLVGNPLAVPPEPGSIALYDAAKVAKVGATADRDGFIKAGRDFISNVVSLLEIRLGKRWSTAWNAVGFTNGSLAIPRDPFPQLSTIFTYFTANPTHQSADPDISATRANTISGDISSSRSALNDKEVKLAENLDTREGDEKILYKRMTGLRAELDQLLGDDDPRWYAFGFSRPADGDGPGPVKTLTLSPAGSGNLIADWSHSVRSERYRVFKKIVGTDPDPVQVASEVEGRTFTLLGLPSGETAEVFIVPVNEAGDGPHSPTVSAVVP